MKNKTKIYKVINDFIFNDVNYKKDETFSISKNKIKKFDFFIKNKLIKEVDSNFEELDIEL